KAAVELASPYELAPLSASRAPRKIGTNFWTPEVLRASGCLRVARSPRAPHGRNPRSRLETGPPKTSRAPALPGKRDRQGVSPVVWGRFCARRAAASDLDHGAPGSEREPVQKPHTPSVDDLWHRLFGDRPLDELRDEGAPLHMFASLGTW